MEEQYNIPKEHLGHKRLKYSTWDENFMLHAVVASARSKDPSSQVGACIVDKNNKILSLGYNGAPSGWDDSEFPWDREAKNPIYTKYPYVIHAEMNAILNFKGNISDLEGATVYVTLFPCSNCAKCLRQVGIKRIVYLSNKYDNTPDNVSAKICFNQGNIIYEEFPKHLQRDLLVSLRENVGVKEIETEEPFVYKKVKIIGLDK